MRSYGSMKSNYFPSKKGFTLYKSVINHPVRIDELDDWWILVFIFKIGCIC